jgi:hypothetical protein
MKNLFIFFFFSIFCVTGYSQGLTAPAPLTIEANTSGNDAGDFVVSWPNNTDQILVSVSIDYHSGASISFPTTTGLTLNPGYTIWTNITSIVFYGVRDNINTALAAMTLTMGSIKTAIRINVEISNYDANYVYNPNNKHFYRYINGNINYTNARTNAGTYSFKGKTGYLLTITSQSEQDFVFNNISGSNIWFAATDEVTDGTWVIDAGPEKGTILKTQNGQTAGNIAGVFNNWCSGEPNGAAHTEDYAVTKWGGSNCWNDLPNSYSTVAGYIIEISADFPAGSDYTGVYAAYVVHNNDIAYSLNSASILNATNTSNYANAFGGLQVNSGHAVTLNSGTILNTNKLILSGTGKIVFTDSTSKWKPGTATNLNTFIHSPSTNANPTYWSVSSSWNNITGSTGVGDPFYPNAPYSSPTQGLHYTPWLNSPQGWSAQILDANQYIILNYDVPAYITGIVVQGRALNGGQWVNTANVDVSIDGTNWTRVLTSVAINTNSTDAVTVLFPNVVYAKFVKLMPTASGWTNHITMRMGLIIKSNNIVPDGLVLNLDAGNLTSYKGTGTTWNDLSAIGNNGTLINSPTYNVQNKGYFTFNGSSNYINGVALPSTSGNNSRTVMIWYKSTANQNVILLDKGSYNIVGQAEQLALGYTNTIGAANAYPPTNTGGVYLAFWGNDIYYPIASATIFDGNWHFIAYTYDNSNSSVRICFDGLFASSVYYWTGSWTTLSSKPFPLSSSINTTNNVYYIGYSRAPMWSNGGYYANASVSLVQIYSRALSEAEILVNYNATKTRYGK